MEETDRNTSGCRIWENREITGGNAFPACDWTAAIAVEKIYGLQHKDDPWK